MEIKLWQNFSKRVNSTKQPSADAAITKAAVLKAPTSVESPTFTISGNDYTYNYAQAFGHYYFITDIINNTNGTSDLICEQDRMGTYKSSIGSYAGLIDYAAVSNNVQITDPRNYPTQEITSEATEFTALTGLSASGMYILGVINNKASSCGGITYYAMTTAQMQSFRSAITTTVVWEMIENQFNNVNNCIISCIWLPLNINSMIDTGHLGALDSVAIGGIDLISQVVGEYYVNGYKLNNRIINVTASTHNISFPSKNSARPFYNAGFTYLDKSPYSTGEMYLPFVGAVPLDLDVVAPSRAITMGVVADIATGDIVYSLYRDSKIIQTYGGNMATKVPVSAASYDGIGVATGILGTIGGTVGGAVAGFAKGGAAGAVLGGVAGLATGAITTAKSAELHMTVNGSVSSAVSASLGLTVQITVWTYAPAESDLDAWRAEQGLPYYEYNTVSNCAGYVQTHNASVSLSGFGGDREAVNAMMNAGFYYE